jgi:hypothetical protein
MVKIVRTWGWCIALLICIAHYLREFIKDPAQVRLTCSYLYDLLALWIKLRLFFTLLTFAETRFLE